MFYKSLLQDFDETALASYIDQDLGSRVLVGRGRSHIQGFTYVVGLSRRYEGVGLKYDLCSDVKWNRYHVELAFVKALKCLHSLGLVEFVSLTKTKLTRGVFHVPSGRYFQIHLSEKVVDRVSGMIAPVRWLKAGDC